MKIIFLDIDGVLNYVCMPESDQCGTEYPFNHLSKSRVKQLNELTNETGAKIVISSSWRKSGTNDAADKLVLAGVTGEIISQTPTEKGFGNIRIFRGNEIYTWMQLNEKLLGCSASDFKRYVILDDDSDMLLWQSANFIHTDRYVGLSEQAAYRAKRILMVG